MLASGSFLHGDENNANVAGGTNGEGAFVSPTGTGWIPSYAVINLQGTYHVNKYAEIFGRLVNVANKQYSTAGFLTSNSFTPNGHLRDRPGRLDQRELSDHGAAARDLGRCAHTLQLSARD